MASISVPCPKTASLVAVASANGGVFGSNSQQKQMRVWFPRTSSLSLSFGSSTLPGFKWLERKQSAVMKVQAQLNDVMTETSSNSEAVLETKSKVPILVGKDNSVESNITQASAIPAFLAQVSNLVKLVDSRDIVELELKQLDCELIIRKKEALQQSAPASPVITMQPTYPHAALSTLAPAASAAASATAKPPPPVPTPALPLPTKTSSSSHPQLKCPMAGTFYRSPAPGEPPFVKVGDKVQKGQVVCIIEAMKLMNEIEADQSGTITEILVDDGKPVSVDTPLFIIAP